MCYCQLLLWSTDYTFCSVSFRFSISHFRSYLIAARVARCCFCFLQVITRVFILYNGANTPVHWTSLSTVLLAFCYFELRFFYTCFLSLFFLISVTKYRSILSFDEHSNVYSIFSFLFPLGFLSGR